MSNSIIEVNNLSKSYTITHPQGPVDEGRERYTALSDVVAQKAKKIFPLFHLVKQRINHKDTKAQRVILRLTFAARNFKSYFVLLSRLITQNASAFSFVPLCLSGYKILPPAKAN